MKQPLWTPSEERIKNANMTDFIRFVNRKHATSFGSYGELYRWSIERIAEFWEAMWEYGGIIASRKYDRVVDDLEKFPGARWFPGARLNFAENLLRFRDNETAFIFRGETQISARMTYKELYSNVSRLASSLRKVGVAPGDRVVAYMPNMIETSIAMLAATSIGAIWSSCATDIGAQAALDRLGQIEPKVLFTADGYFYKGKVYNSLHNVSQIVEGIATLKKVVVVPYVSERPDLRGIPNAILYKDFLSEGKDGPLDFVQLPFEHPVYIMFSSGTTGKPKCLV